MHFIRLAILSQIVRPFHARQGYRATPNSRSGTEYGGCSSGERSRFADPQRVQLPTCQCPVADSMSVRVGPGDPPGAPKNMRWMVTGPAGNWVDAIVKMEAIFVVRAVWVSGRRSPMGLRLSE